MAASYWQKNQQSLFMPPTPVARTLSTDEYITRTGMFYYANSERMLMVGNPFYTVQDTDKNVLIAPKVSGNQWRVFRCNLPDPNRFVFQDGPLINSDTERAVWCLKGVEVGRGQPLGPAITGNFLFNKFEDVENPLRAPGDPTKEPNQAQEDEQQRNKETRKDIAFDPKQMQVIIVGNKPAMGEYWTKARDCSQMDAEARPYDKPYEYAAGDCPGLELISSYIQDGEMGDIGLGALDFSELAKNKSDLPLDLVNETAKYPDYLNMTQDTYGDSLWFYSRREQVYYRHYWNKNGQMGDAVPKDFYRTRAAGYKLGSYVYMGSPSGSLVSTDGQIFNRPYWLQNAQGLNNGVCWHNEVFVTVFDNTRGTLFTVSVPTNPSALTEQNYKPEDYKVYNRHVEEYDLQFIFELCTVTLTPEIITHIYTMDKEILEGWDLGIAPPNNASLSDIYRNLESKATKCPYEPGKKTVTERYPGTFWKVDLSGRFSQDLMRFSLGRRFLAQGISSRRIQRPAVKRKASTKRASKKRKTTTN